MCLAGCWVTSSEVQRKLGADADVDTDVDSDSDAPIEITAIDPAQGSVLGGGTARITAGPLGSDVQVWFADVEAAIQSKSRDDVVVTIPEGAAEGWVDLEVRSGSQRDTLDEAFWYWRDGTGKAGAVGEVTLVVTVGGYWSRPDPAGYAWVGLLRPTPFVFWELFAPSLDTCVRDYEYPGSLALYELDATEIQLSHGASTLVLPRDGANHWYETPVDQTSYAFNTTFDLDPIAASVPFEGLEVASLTRTPAIFSVTRPDVAGTLPPWVQRNTVLEWNGSGGTAMIVEMVRLDDGGAVADRVTCALRDDGYHVVPTSVWSGWDPLSELYLDVGRVIVADTPLPNTGATSQVAGVLWIRGAAFQDF